MRALLCVLLAVACARADESENRRSKLPYIADAVGNTLPPPSNGPATVGSPVNLITPDRYEFYTFDESGELVKRLMTLEEIQAIVAAGEETEGLVTFANENQPTIAFNFSQPPYTKVHSVVTNVQNVLKAQMEAHKKKPITQPTLDTPDVSDSWSLILPSIFGNTGVDIVPDKMSGSFTTPETETIDLDRPIDDNSLSKEGTSQILSSTSTKPNVDLKDMTVTEKSPAISSTTEKLKLSSTTTTTTTTTTTSTPKPTTVKPRSTTTTTKATTTTVKPTTTTLKSTTTPSKATTVKLRTTSITTTTNRPRTSTTSKPRTTITSKSTAKAKVTTARPNLTTTKLNPTKKTNTTTHNFSELNFTKIETFTNTVSANNNKSTVQYEKVSTFVPLSTAAYVTEKSTKKPDQVTKAPSVSTTKRYLPSSTRTASTTKLQPSITTYKPLISTSAYVSSSLKDEVEEFNATTITTQSVSPSTTAASTEFVAVGHHNPTEKNSTPNDDKNNHIKEVEPEINFFDVAQSFSQIASDLGGDYQPIPTTSDLLDTTKLSDINLESKENVEIEIPETTKVEKSEVQNTTTIENPVQKAKPTKIETPSKLQALVEPIKPNALSKPVSEKTTIKEEKPVNDTKPSVVDELTIVDKTAINEKYSATDEKHTDNFVKISTLEPHQNDNKISINDSIVKSVSKTTEASSFKFELTTITPVISSTIDPVLSESMEDLFSQVVNQAPPSIFEAQKQSKIKNQNTNKNPIKDEHEEIKVTKIPELNKSNQSMEIIDYEIKNITNDIPQINTETKEPEIKLEEQNPFTENNKTNSHNKESIGIKQNLVKITEPIIQKEQKVQSPIKTTAITEDLSQVVTKVSQKPENATMNKENNTVTRKPVEIFKKGSEIHKATTTTENSPQLEHTKKSTISADKPEKVQSNANKIASSEHNKISNVKENEKISPQIPKLEEFKKKIQKVNIDDKELVNERNNSWKLISTVTPPKANEIPKDKLKTDSQENTDKDIVLEFSKENQGLEVTTKDLSEDIAQFTELCNELAFRYWQTMTESIEKRRSFILSPYSITSMLAMMFMGARGATSGEMNEILKLDDMVTFNPHFTLKNISDSIDTRPSSGVIVSAFVRELFSDKGKGKILTFYKERAQHFYNGHVEEINFKLISDIIRRRTNLLVKRYTWGRIAEYMKSNTITMQPPLAAFSANIFQTDCSESSVEGRDGEMYFVVSPNVRQRRLVPVPAVVYRSGFLAGYDPGLDATAAALGNTNSVISTLFLMPGQQGNVVHAEDLEALEKRLLDANPTTPAWNRLLRTLLPRIGLELQIPRFSHKSIFNVSTTLQKMGLKELFDPEHADLGGLNGPSKDLYLSDMVQSTTFVTCGEGVIGEQHHIEEYPDSLNGPQRRRTSRWVTGWDEPRDYQRAFHDPHDVGEAMNLPLHLRPRQARLPSRIAQPARLKFDRPFLYFVRHNPTGMILYVGRYNPRLLP